MTAQTPTEDQILDAIVAQLQSMDPLPGTVLSYENPMENEEEFLEKFWNVDGEEEVNLWLVDVKSGPEEEGDATGEVYVIHDVTLRYVCILPLDEEEWSRIAHTRAERVRTQLSGNSSVFAIGGQRQLRTPETVSKTGDFTEIGSTRYYQIELALSVEARRWS